MDWSGGDGGEWSGGGRGRLSGSVVVVGRVERYLLVGQMSGVSEELLYAGSVPAQRVVWYHERVLVPRERQHPAKKTLLSVTTR